jgi:hypothetical protein
MKRIRILPINQHAWWLVRAVINLWTAWRHYVSRKAGRLMRGSSWFFISTLQLSAPLAICSQLQLVSGVVRHGAVYLEQRVFLYDTYETYGSTRKCRHKFHDERVPSRQTIHNLVNKLRTMGLLTDKKQKHKRRILTKETLDDIEARLEYSETSLNGHPSFADTSLLRTIF